jgi:serine/threonine protein kinase
MQLAPNVVIAERFKLIRLLGQGGMGSVWLATHLGLDIPCAVKFIEGEFAQMAEAQARFEREAKAAASLRSPHVVQILDHGIFDGTPYIAMELLDGEEFGKRLHRVGRMNPAEVVRIISEVGRALTKAHAIGIVHRDLKPENIYLVRDDDREIAKVLDFGIAKATGAGGIDGSNTKTGAMLGTPYYMSPEQAQGVKAVDHRSDLWSLGVIVFQALTGRLPFESEALGDLLVRIIVAPVPMASQFVNDLPPTFEQWWAKASQRDPAMRFQTSKEFCETLASVFGQSRGEWGGDANLAPRPPQGSGQFGSTPNPLGMTPQPLGMTPNPLGMTPQPLGMTPQPFGMTGQPVAVTPQPFGATGQMGMAPQMMPADGSGQYGAQAIPQKKTGMFIGIGIGAAAAVILAIVGISMSGKGKPTDAAQAPNPPAQPTMVATADKPPPPAASPQAPEPVATHEVLAQPPTQADTAAPAVSTAKAHTAAATPAARPAAPAAPAAPKKPARVDLGI